MTGLEHFARLKQEVLSEYRKHFPYFTGDWKSFSSQDIQNLIELIETNLRETVSEKWVYMHLKPGRNEKLPRKDMLDIFSRFCGYSGWDEFAFEAGEPAASNKRSRNLMPYYIGIGAIAIVALFFIFAKGGKQSHSIKVTDQYTGKPIRPEEIEVFEKDSAGEKQIPLTNGAVVVTAGKPTQVVVKSPYYAPQAVTINPASDSTEIRITPDDHAMMLKAFIKSDIKDWQTRKAQLDKILDDNLEVIIMLKDNLGAESLNKKEFAQKLIIPTPSLRQLKIIDIKYGADHKIQFIRMAQQ